MSRLGRNPFENKPHRAVDFVKQMDEPKRTEKLRENPREKLRERLARFVLVDVRAESYLFALKAYLLSLSILTD